mgnify:CR=1 FL=1
MNPARPLMWLCAAALAAVAGGCTFDQGERLEIDAFLAEWDRLVPREDEPAAGLPPAPAGTRRTYRIGPDDELEVSITGVHAPGAVAVLNCRVASDGTVNLPLLPGGRFAVAGRTAAECVQALHGAYSPRFIRNPRIAVRVGEPSLSAVVVSGAVATPGLVRLRSDEMDAATALARAGWLRENATGLVRVRGAGGSEEFRLDRPADLSRARNRRLADGDALEAETRPAEAAFVTGLVRTPGAVPLPARGRMDLLQLLAACGGTRDDVDPRSATLVRAAPDGRVLRARIDLNELFAGRTPPVPVRVGDVLDVHHTDRTRTLEFARLVVQAAVNAGVNAAAAPLAAAGGGR